MPDHSEAIQNLEAALASGVRVVNIEGTQTTYGSVDELEAALDYFRRNDTATQKSGKARRTMNRTRLF